VEVEPGGKEALNVHRGVQGIGLGDDREHPGMKHVLVALHQPVIYKMMTPERAYRMLRKRAEWFAKGEGREVAEGPTQMVYDNPPWGPVELWPLVPIEDVT
jgi:hypothetical protein